MGRIEKSIEIKASLEKVWELIALDRLPEWNEEYGNVKYTSEVRNPEDKYRVGASSHTNIKGAGAIDFEITESLKNEKMTFRMLGKRANNTVVTYVLKSVEEGFEGLPKRYLKLWFCFRFGKYARAKQLLKNG